jgi:hypothetical protein
MSAKTWKGKSAPQICHSSLLQVRSFSCLFCNASMCKASRRKPPTEWGCIECSKTLRQSARCIDAFRRCSSLSARFRWHCRGSLVISRVTTACMATNVAEVITLVTQARRARYGKVARREIQPWTLSGARQRLRTRGVMWGEPSRRKTSSSVGRM